jgi:nitrogen fixation protein NifQ
MEAPMFDERYAALRAAQTAKDDEGEAFDDHVFACALSAALADQVATGLALTEGLGLTRAETAALFAARFPLRAAPLCLERAPDPVRAMEEDLLRDLLASYCAHPGEQSGWLAAILARRAMRDDHLWQDLGLFSRGELGRLLQRHFPTLHAGNANNMRWKKFFYRRICELEGFSLCAAPHCSVCVDFASCFGDEDGLSRLAMPAREAAAGREASAG